MTALVVAIDGPAGAGKSTVARRVARALGFALVDTGAIYRSVALLALRNGTAFDDDAALARLVRDLRIRFRFEGDINHVWLDDEDVTSAIRTPEIDRGASEVSARPVVRAGLLELQRRLAGETSAVLEGRDIGTVVCPHANLKVFLDASIDERARRRHAELRERGDEVSFERIRADVEERDARDRSRDTAPLRPADDALVIDCTRLDADAVVAQIVGAVAGLTKQ